MMALARITLCAAERIVDVVEKFPPGEMRAIEIRRVVRSAVEEAVYTLPPGELASLLDDRAAFERDAARRVA